MSFTQVDVSDFSELGFAAGKVRGARAFIVGGGYSAGILMGAVYRQWWLPGEMRAICLKQSERYEQMYNEGFGVDVTNNPEFIEPNHSMENCLHGLYAFYDGSNDYHRTDSMKVQGVVEGYGEVMIGSRGFRSTRAKLVALCDEGREDALDRDFLHRNYESIPWFDSFDHMISEFPLGEL